MVLARAGGLLDVVFEVVRLVAGADILEDAEPLDGFDFHSLTEFLTGVSLQNEIQVPAIEGMR